jgi:hypothetical protein
MDGANIRQKRIFSLALPKSAQGRGKKLLKNLAYSQSFVGFQWKKGYCIPGNEVTEAAQFLKDNCDYSDFQVESNIKRFGAPD